MSSKSKIILSVMLIILGNSVVFFCFSIVHFNNHIEELINNQRETTQILVSTIEEQRNSYYKERLKSFVDHISIASQGMLLKSFKEQNREKLLSVTSPILDIFKRENPDFISFAFILPDNTNLLRVHNPKKFGDNVSKMRPDIADANLELRQNAGYIVAGPGLIYAIVQPLIFEKQHLGSVQFGINENQLLNIIEKNLQLPVAIIIPSDKSAFITDTRTPGFISGSHTIRSHELSFFKNADSQIDWSLEQQRVSLGEKHYIVVNVLKLRDYKGDVQGEIVVYLDISSQISDIYFSSIFVIVLGCILLLLSFIILNKGYGTLGRTIALKAAELNEEKERLTVTLRSVGDGVITTDLAGNIVLINKVTEQLTGWSQQDAYGRPIPEVFNIINQKTGEPSENPVDKVLASGQIVELANHTVLIARDGTRYIIEDSAAPIFDKESNIIGVVLVFRNVTDKKQKERQLRRIIDIVPSMIFVKNIEGRFFVVNQPIADSYNMDVDDIVGKLHSDIHPDKEQVIKMLAADRKAIEGGKTVFIPKESYLDSAGNTRWLQTVKVPCPEDVFGEPAIVGIATDITDQVVMEEELLKVKKLESVGVLAGGIAHDFNNILAAILGNIELAEIHTDSNNKIYPLLQSTKKASIRATGLTQQLLTFAKGGNPVKETSSIAQITMDSANFVLHGSSVRCDFNIPDDLWKVNVDTGQISQVIQNIIINSRDAMPGGGVITVSCENITDINAEGISLPGGKYIKITIVDSGSGISQKYMERIFDPYFSTKQDGSGLGLAICHSIISKHGGNISARSDTGKGTTFTIYLPASLESIQDIVPDVQDHVKAEKTATIMVMDDEFIVRDLARQMLELSGHKVVLVENGQEAIEVYNEYGKNKDSIDLVIMDLTIPGGMGGKEAVQEILKINPDARVIVASGYSNDPAMAHCQEYGFIASIAKPFQLQELNKLLNTVLS